MDEKKNVRKRADGIRKGTNVARARGVTARTPRASVPEPARKPEEHYEQATVRTEPKPSDFFERSNNTSALKGSQVIHDSSFKQEVLPRGFPLFRHKNAIALIAGAGSIFVAWLVLSTVFARVTITIKPAVESLQINDIHIAFDASVSEVNTQTRVVPAELLSFDGSAKADFPATGNEVVNQKATGRVRIYNAFGTAAQTLVARTRFVADSNAILFRLPKMIVIPAAKKDETGAIIPQFIETDLVADQAGVGSNMTGEVTLHIPGFKGGPKYDGFYAVTENGFSGGHTGEGRVVTRADLEAAQENVSKKVFDDLKQGMAQKIPAHFTFVDSLSEIQITDIVAPKEKTRADTFMVEAKAVAHVFVFRDMDIMQLMNKLFIGDDVKKSLIDHSANLRYQIKNTNYDKKVAHVVVNGAVKTKTLVDGNNIAELAAGKKEGSLIEAMKARRDVATFRVRFFPPWIFSVPKNVSQIHVIIEEPTGDAKPMN